MTGLSTTSRLWICILWLLATVNGQLLQRKMTTPNHPRKPFSITQTRNPNWVPREIPVTVVYAAPFRKHKLRMPEPLKEAVMELAAEGDLNSTNIPPQRRNPRRLRHKRANGLKTNNTNGLYTYPVGIGSPPQTLNILFDTGSGDFWVWSWLMPDTITKGRKIYNASLSSESSRWNGQSFNVPYASGSAYGLVWQDTVWADGDIGIVGNPVECAQDVGGDNIKALTGVDGIMGLNTWINDSEQPVPQQTWLNFYIQNYLPAPVFTVSLVRGGAGTIDFGQVDRSKYTGSIIWTPVIPLPGWDASGYWLMNWSGWAIGKGAFNKTTTLVLTDTGCNLTLLPISMAIKYYSQVRGAYQLSSGFWTFPCASTLPTFTFGIGTARITIQPKNMVFLELDDKVMCLGAIQNTDDDSYVLIGTPWLEGLFLIHDYGQKRLGFGTRA